jgi:hemolysin activation/secretion protein
MKRITLYLLVSTLFLNADSIVNIPNKNINDEQEKKIFIEQNRDKVIEENKTYDMKLIEVNENSKEDECIEIEKISVKNSKVFDEDYFEDLIRPYLNNCNGMKNLSNLRDKISNIYIDKGYVTSRAYFKPQDLSDGEIEIEILEGKVEKIEDENIKSSNLYSSYKDKILNLRDLEIIVQQAQRLKSQKADIQLIPGTKVGYTIVKIIGEQVSKPYSGNLGINNFGNDKTGKYQLSSNINYENPFNINDMVNLNVNTTNNILESNDNTLGTSLGYSFPLYRALFNFEYTYSNYKQLNKDEFNNDFQSDGKNNSFTLEINYKLYHSRRNTLDIFSSFESKQSNNFLNDTKLELQSYKINNLSLGLKHSYLGDSFDYYSKWTVVKGLGGTESFARQETDFLKYILDLGYSKYFQTDNELKFTSSLRAQYSSNYLYGTEEISMGGVYSVRGFNDTGLSGNTGFYFRNELSPTYTFDNVNISPYLAFDYGYVQEDEHNIYGSIVGGVIGSRIAWKNINFDIFYSAPLKDSDFTKEDSASFVGLNMIYFY